MDFNRLTLEQTHKMLALSELQQIASFIKKERTKQCAHSEVTATDLAHITYNHHLYNWTSANITCMYQLP